MYYVAFNLEHFLPELLQIDDGHSPRSLSDDELAVVEYVFKREFSVPEAHAIAHRYMLVVGFRTDFAFGTIFCVCYMRINGSFAAIQCVVLCTY